MSQGPGQGALSQAHGQGPLFGKPMTILLPPDRPDEETLILEQIKRGERVLLCWAGANHDPTVFERPDEMVINRFPNLHQAFGLGIHRCLGSSFARAEFSAAIEQVLRRMPDYELVDNAVHYESIGVVNGWHRLPARFTPGTRLGAPAPAAAR